MRHADLKRVGMIVPAGNMALEWEFSRYLPSGLTFNTARAPRPGSTDLDAASLLAMGDAALPAAASLLRTKPELLLYGCTSGSFLPGASALPERITAGTGLPCVTTAQAVIDAHRLLEIKQVVLLTPYPDAINAEEIAWLGRAGIEVTLCDSLPCNAAHPIGAVDDRETVELALRNRAAIAQAEALFISCTNLLTLDRIAELEATLGCPVITSNLASLHAVLRHLGNQLWEGPSWRLMSAPTS